MQPPTGGEKDISPPKIKKSNPESGSTNFKGNAIRLDFDEFVVLNNLQQELIVSPPLKNNPDFKIKGKSLFIGFSDTLLENTTYTFNLGDGIKDFHEGNVLDSNIVVFSTGNSIDSGLIAGTIQDAYNLKPIEKVLVMLYPTGNDSTPAKQKPIYYSKSKSGGQFLINHLKNAEYNLFVLDDKNNNYIYDLPNERIGFVESSVTIADTGIVLNNEKIRLFQEFIPNQFYVGSKVESYGKIMLGFNQPIQQLALNVLNKEEGTDWYIPEFDEEKDTVWIWTTLSANQDESINIEILDNGIILDTAEIKLQPFPESEDDIAALSPKITLDQKNGVVKFFEPLKLKSSQPITTINFAGILINKGDTQKLSLKKVDNRTFILPYDLKQESNYLLLVYDSSFVDLFGLSHDTLSFNFKTLSDIEYASLNVKIENSSNKNKIVQFMESSEKEILKEIVITKDQELAFPNLSAGKYKLKMIFDDNNNGKWDPGSFIPRKQPERAIYFSGELEMKEGWDKKITWIIPE